MVKVVIKFLMVLNSQLSLCVCVCVYVFTAACMCIFLSKGLLVADISVGLSPNRLSIHIYIYVCGIHKHVSICISVLATTP